MVEDCGGGSQALAAARGAAIRYAPSSLPSFPNTPMLLSSALWLCNIGPTLSYYRKLSWRLRILADVSTNVYCGSVKVQQPKNGVVNTGHIHLPAHQFLLNIGLVGWLWSLDYCHRRGTSISVAFPKEDISVSFWVKFQECSQAGNLSSTEQVCQR